ncbi:uncharacterized protein L969DRAFT_95921 [Mixia osmundae IAM 14324]|uniref:Uncharacterized protein n=1 Tax=Mixia osmundae (strain CBS 9802 / IAM 14324 / JCM 22182 / KY 12970) TaxID=764103 RepID=G7DX12_MIXOS|nr:uncharacterized protein L969DRAFT_95921 [Mixia osmundae IAM 14324]KEI38082.1 hypothetical protein L969DRAFT_95921 [Mixia osmundae IAM 14324]GAA95109.1 hypothetical protein E5Q_01764 [Mixia osmundae IAM 14324]
MAGKQALNVYGQQLAKCSVDPKLTTGFYRDGFCNTGPEDRGKHTVAAIVSDEWLQFSKKRGNDLTQAFPPMFPGLKDGCRWCLCQDRFKEALDAFRDQTDGSLSERVVPKVVLAATHKKALETISLPDLEMYAIDKLVRSLRLSVSPMEVVRSPHQLGHVLTRSQIGVLLVGMVGLLLTLGLVMSCLRARAASRLKDLEASSGHALSRTKTCGLDGPDRMTFRQRLGFGRPVQAQETYHDDLKAWTEATKLPRSLSRATQLQASFVQLDRHMQERARQKSDDELLDMASDVDSPRFAPGFAPTRASQGESMLDLGSPPPYPFHFTAVTRHASMQDLSQHQTKSSRMHKSRSEGSLQHPARQSQLFITASGGRKYSQSSQLHRGTRTLRQSLAGEPHSGKKVQSQVHYAGGAPLRRTQSVTRGLSSQSDPSELTNELATSIKASKSMADLSLGHPRPVASHRRVSGHHVPAEPANIRKSRSCQSLRMPPRSQSAGSHARLSASVSPTHLHSTQASFLTPTIEED